MPRFVILFHDTPPGFERPPHLDLMLEAGDVLRTFALPHFPAAGETVGCEQLPDHRLAYLDYEGPVSDRRGSVARHDAGEYEIVSGTSETLVLRLRGQRCTGTLALLRRGEGTAWEAIWQPALNGA